MRLPDPPLLVISDRKQASRPIDIILQEAMAAGCRWISVREKDLPASEQVRLLRRLRGAADRYGATLLLHGHPTLALEGGANGVHLVAGGSPQGARALLGPDALVGLSVHTAAEAAASAGADYVVGGPVYATSSKPGYGPHLGPAGLNLLRASSRVPLVAIGGISAAHVQDVFASGAAGIAVMGAVMRAADVAAGVGELLAAMRGAYAARPPA